MRPVRHGSLRPKLTSLGAACLSTATAVTRALEARNTGYLAIYGVSANTRSWWRLGQEAERLGWAPVDNAEHSAARLGITPEAGHNCRQGGIYVDTDYRGGYW
jgi:hypothetical protein